ncbi:MAG: hypothetical protein JWO95_768 [Verrucomicrobiales bacterium]|nr:hypothetical protein [Verrucomicrobiales bacterium]
MLSTVKQLFYTATVRKPVLAILGVLVFAGCSDQLENENTALKAQYRSLSETRKADETKLTLLSTNINSLQEKIRELQTSDQDQIADQKRTIAMLSTENVRQKEDIENLRRALADEKALFEKYKDAVTLQLQKPGRVKVTLTYKSDKAAESIPDNGATVSLHLIKDTTVVYRGVAAADGVVALEHVKPGKYLCVIHSGNAHQRMRPGGPDLVRRHIWKTDRTMLASYLDDGQIKLLDRDLSDSDASGHFLEALLAKTFVKEIEIGPQDQVPINYDFGQGAF